MPMCQHYDETQDTPNPTQDTADPHRPGRTQFVSKKKVAVIAGIVIAGAVALACSSGGNSAAPRNTDTVQDAGAAPAAPAGTEAAAPAPKPAAVPVTATGSGEGVQTVELVASGYTVKYEAASFCLIVTPVKADGSEGMSIVNDCASSMNATVSGTAVYRATGPVTLHVHNTSAAWTLTFTPLA